MTTRTTHRGVAGRGVAGRGLAARGVAGSVLAVVGLLLAVDGACAQDSNLLEQQILKALVVKKPAIITRGLTTTIRETPESETRLLDSVKNKTTRSITLDEREQLADLAKKKPSIDVEVSFDYGSSNIGQSALPYVTALGKALSNDDLKGSTFLIAGHTDGAGSAPFNQDLSERRADSIKRYLVDHYNIPAQSLVTVGYGKSKLKNARNPNAPENRRAQVANME
jgi:outer membrane protein OmpA-like peptidoglycan-associated protein